ncbi:hypothetical protein WR25_24615 [Diploscapter pachys]|uniref:Uncharacterized protein n=1 Tax=Diploscapter pachys TaxID=2018661 RepID=A0A2A2M393_9BILA|nr:hypothetical protein WR25_24615 [Diploscapter pachys]
MLGVGVHQRLAQQAAGRGRQVDIAEPDAGVGGNPLESGREGAIVDDLAAGAINVVWDHIERCRQDHAEQSVAADHMPEQLCILVARRGDYPAVCKHQPDAAQRAHHRARLMIHAVRVDADRPPDGEDVAPLPTVTVRAAGSSRIASMPRMSSTTPPERNAWPPIECFTPAAETVSPWALA